MCGPDDTPQLPSTAGALDWRSAVECALHAAGLRASSARLAILDWIAGAERPFTAETIVHQLVLGGGLGSRPTVYRTVDWLRGAGWLARLHAEGGDRAYVRSLPGGHLLVCTSCGGVQMLTSLDLTALVFGQLQALGFELSGQHLELYGRCRSCRPAISDRIAPYIEEKYQR